MVIKNPREAAGIFCHLIEFVYERIKNIQNPTRFSALDSLRNHIQWSVDDVRVLAFIAGSVKHNVGAK